MESITVGFLGYLLGSLPWAVVVARHYGVDILSQGSGNPGATNVRRILGKGPGRLVFFLDALKGFLATSWPAWVFGGEAGILPVLGLMAVLLGTSYSCFLRFKGGKGMAAAIGGLCGLMPSVLALGLGVWLGVFGLFRYVSLASMAMSASLPFWAWLLKKPKLDVLTALTIAVWVIWRHRANIKRLAQGVEHRFTKSP